jgi:hypothetical protein
VLTIVLAALGAICVASAVFLILELSDPYSGLFRMPHEGFDGIIRVLAKGVASLFRVMESNQDRHKRAG